MKRSSTANVKARTILGNVTLVVLLVLVIVGGAVVYLIYSTGGFTRTPLYPAELGKPISAALYANLSGVSLSALSQVGKGQGVSPPKSVTGSPLLTYQGKPEVLYIGAEYCPYCAAERWSMIVALSKFGNFSGIQYMQSSSSDSFANTVTFTFVSSNYSSPYISFVSVEYQDRSGAPLQTVSQSQQALWSKYDPSQGIPFVDIGNQFIASTLYSPGTIAGHNWTQVASQLDDPSSSIAKRIDGGANGLITAICKIDGGRPSSICDRSFALLPLALVPSQLERNFLDLTCLSQEAGDSTLWH